MSRHAWALTAVLDEQLPLGSICVATSTLKLLLGHVRIVCSVLLTWVRPSLDCPAKRKMSMATSSRCKCAPVPFHNIYYALLNRGLTCAMRRTMHE